MNNGAQLAASERRARPWASPASWIVLGIVAVVLLILGSIHPAFSSRTARTSALDSVIKCPQCDDLSIAESNAPSSLQLRHRVEGFVAAGWSNERIESWVTARYGSGALLLPPDGGASETLYLLPVAFVVLAAGALGWYLWRRRSPRKEDPVVALDD